MRVKSSFVRSSMYFSSIRRSWSSKILAPSVSSLMIESRDAARLPRAALRARSRDTSCAARPAASWALALDAASCLRCSISFSMCCERASTFLFEALVAASALNLNSFSFFCLSSSDIALALSRVRSSEAPNASWSWFSKCPHLFSSLEFAFFIASNCCSNRATVAAPSIPSSPSAAALASSAPAFMSRVMVAEMRPVADSVDCVLLALTALSI
mmetsp:Transcript_14006/g.32625  ORF Transcript_14006/g.32625 Transcript_14006/m.32625 type:complete len:214 (+) Transcript_14006:620-1261(+)